MFDDSVKLLWTSQGASLDEIRERDQQINRQMRQVRKKVLTHLAFSGQSGLDTSLTLISIVIDVERIGDHTKDITVLATEYPGHFSPGIFEAQIKAFQESIRSRLVQVIEIIDREDVEKANQLSDTHREVGASYSRMLSGLIKQ